MRKRIPANLRAYRRLEGGTPYTLSVASIGSLSGSRGGWPGAPRDAHATVIAQRGCAPRPALHPRPDPQKRVSATSAGTGTGGVRGHARGHGGGMGPSPSSPESPAASSDARPSTPNCATPCTTAPGSPRTETPASAPSTTDSASEDTATPAPCAPPPTASSAPSAPSSRAGSLGTPPSDRPTPPDSTSVGAARQRDANHAKAQPEKLAKGKRVLAPSGPCGSGGVSSLCISDPASAAG